MAVDTQDWLDTATAAELIYGSFVDRDDRNRKMHATRDLARRGTIRSEVVDGEKVVSAEDCRQFAEANTPRAEAKRSAAEVRDALKLDPALWLTPEEAAELAGRSRPWAYNAIKQHKLWGREFKGVWLVSKASVEQYLKEQGEHGSQEG